MFTKKILISFLASTALSFVFMLTANPQQVLAMPSAFSGSNAATYADKYATTRNSNYPSYGSDCTNFASQALHSGGGYPFRQSGSNQWWVKKNWWGGWDKTLSWSVVVNFWNFLIADWPGGWDWGYQDTSKSYNAAYKGDILFYDWDGNGTLDHVSVEVAYSGCDPAHTNYCGDLVDEHTSDRYHAIWHLRPYNSQAATTKIRLMHIDSGN